MPSAATTGSEDELNAVRHNLLAQHLPLLYVMILIASVLVVFTFRHVAPFALVSIVPTILLTGVAIRMVHWYRQRDAKLTSEQIESQIKRTMILGPVVALAFTTWAGFLFNYGDPYQQAFVALMILICATMTAVCTAVLPVTSNLVIIAACLPFIVKLIVDGNAVFSTMVLAFIAVGIVLQRALRQYFVALNDIVENRLLLTRRNREVTAAKREITRLANSDELTGVANKRNFDAQLEQMIKDNPNPATPITIGVVDLDGFAVINDVFGYASGDQVLKEAARRLESAVWGNGIVARYDGDEFAFILKNAVDEKQALQLGTEICEQLEKHYSVDSHTAILAASCGLVTYPLSGNDPDLLRNRAYYALHEAKQSSRTNIKMFCPEHEQNIQHRSQLEQSLRRAIHDEQLDLAYQPIMDVETGQPTAFEALARWHDKELGTIGPDQFIPIAEQTGLVGDLMVQLLKKAATAANDWPETVQLSFNMSAKEIVKSSTGLRILSILNDSKMSGRQLEIEITETALLENFEAANATIENLKMAGVSIALDDFGTSHASLVYVEKIALDRLKIDRAFMTEIESNERNQHIVKAIIEMCGNLNIKCVAEGIETEAELETLRKLGCRYVQGYYFARPMTASQALQFVDNCSSNKQAAKQKLAG